MRCERKNAEFCDSLSQGSCTLSMMMKFHDQIMKIHDLHSFLILKLEHASDLVLVIII